MMRLISAQLPGHDEGAAALAEKWNAETKNDKVQVDAAVAAPNLKSELLAAWRTAKAGDDQAFVEEYGSKDPVAVQKFSDINAEAYWDDTAGKGALADAKKGLYQAVAAAVVQYQTERARVFPIMTAKRFNYVFAGKKITNIPDLTRRTHSVGALGRAGAMSAAGDAATLKRGLELIAARSGGAITYDAIKADPTAIAEAGTLKMPALRDILRKGEMAPAAMANPSNKLSDYATWFTPGAVTPTPGGEAGYTQLMVLGALQPDWYPDGTILVEVNNAAPGALLEARKPTAFDGLLSALWVARNQPGETYGVTGGGAEEYLMTGPTWSMVTQSSAQVPSEANLQDIVAASERVKARFGQRQHGVNPRDPTGVNPRDPTKPAMTDTTSTGEELLRGNAQPMGGFAQGTYQQVIGATKAHAQSSGAAAPGGVMAPGGGGAPPRAP